MTRGWKDKRRFMCQSFKTRVVYNIGYSISLLFIVRLTQGTCMYEQIARTSILFNNSFQYFIASASRRKKKESNSSALDFFWLSIARTNNSFYAIVLCIRRHTGGKLWTIPHTFSEGMYAPFSRGASLFIFSLYCHETLTALTVCRFENSSSRMKMRRGDPKSPECFRGSWPNAFRTDRSKVSERFPGRFLEVVIVFCRARYIYFYTFYLVYIIVSGYARLTDW